MLAAKARALKLVGILTVTVGFLTPSASSAPLDDSLEELGRMELERAELLTEADSLGAVLTSLPDPESTEATRLHAETVSLEDRSRTIELEILLLRERCRSLAQQELAGIQDPSTPDGRAREMQLLNLLDIVLADDWGDVLVVEPDVDDGYETLVTKQTYLGELREHLLDLDERVARRIERTRRDEALLRASAEFDGELRFLDESGQVNSDARIHPRGAPGESPGGAGRVLPTDSGVEEPGDLWSMAPGPNEGDHDRFQSLANTRDRIERELERVAEALQATEDLLESFDPTLR